MRADDCSHRPWVDAARGNGWTAVVTAGRAARNIQCVTAGRPLPSHSLSVRRARPDGATAWVTTTPGLEAVSHDGTRITPPWAKWFPRPERKFGYLYRVVRVKVLKTRGWLRSSPPETSRGRLRASFLATLMCRD